MAVGQMAGEVIGTKDRHNPVGFVAQNRLSAARCVTLARAGALMIGLDRNRDLAGHSTDFGQGLPMRFSGIEADGACQCVLVIVEKPGKPFKDFDPFTEVAFCPCRKGISCRHDRSVNIITAGGIPLPDDIAIGWIFGVKCFAIAGLPCAIDEQGGI